MNKKLFFFLIFLSFFIQLLLSFYDTYSDVKFYFIPWAESIARYGSAGFFHRKIAVLGAVYPPGSLYIGSAFFNLGKILTKPILDVLWQINIHVPFFPSKLVLFFNKDNILYTFMKLPYILGNVLLAISAFEFIKLHTAKKSKLPLLAFVSLLFNPALIFLGAMWGQIDVLPYALIVWSFLLLKKNSPTASVIVFTAALLIKQTAVLTVPFYLIYLLRHMTFRRIVAWVLLSYSIFVAAFWPFQKTLAEKMFPLSLYAKIATTFGSRMASMHAHNFWAMVAPNATDQSFRLLSQIIVLLFLIFVLAKAWKERNELPYLLAGLGVFGLYSFMFMTRMHERHLLVAIPFMLLAAVLDFRFYWIFLFESLYLLLNMYAAWPVPRIEFLATALNTQWVVDVLIVIQLFVLAYSAYLFIRITSKTKTKKVRI